MGSAQSTPIGGPARWIGRNRCRGLAPLDQQGVSDETVEIADLVLYYGKSPTFDAAESVAIIQFKYSKSLAGVPYRASEIKKTIRKFAQAYSSYKKKHGTKEVDEKLSFD